MNSAIRSQLPAAAALVAVLALALLGAPLWAQIAAGACAAAGLAALRRPADAPARRAAAPEEPPGAMPVGVGRRVLESLPAALVMIDGNGALTFANAPAQALFGRLRPGEHYSLSFRHPDLLDALGRAMRSGGRESFDFVLPAEQERSLRAHVIGGAAEAGGSEGWPQVVCLFEDRTADRLAAQFRTDFIANASHELRTPLASISGYVETLQGAAKDDAEARERFLDVIAQQAARMSRLVDDLLSLSRIELDEHLRPGERVRIGAVAHEAAAALAPVAEARGATIEVEAPMDGPSVLGDRDQLVQALLNLIDNAMKYGRENAPVRVAAAKPTSNYLGMIGISVIDRGEGVAREHIPRLTERFYRVSAKRSRELGGTGLGLAIVKHIVARHRGELEIESRLGEGSRFTIWLPAAKAE